MTKRVKLKKQKKVDDSENKRRLLSYKYNTMFRIGSKGGTSQYKGRQSRKKR